MQNMKWMLCLLISLIVLSCARQRNPVEGSWRLVYAQSVEGDSLVWKFPGDYTGSQIKIWTKGHWAFVCRFKQEVAFTDGYGGGSYTLDGTHYIESIVYHITENYVGTQIKMIIKVEGDTLIQTSPTDDAWQIDKSDYHLEKYVRLD